MAKYRHRIFEMYEFRDEAILVLTPSSGDTVTKPISPPLQSLKHLDVSRSAGVTQVTFKEPRTFGDETVSSLREDFAQLTDRLDRGSKVLLDFTGVESFSAACIDALSLWNKHLRNKGSRIVLCSLSPGTRECFFPDRSP